jgi:RNA polymerase sporulation-specific sigma factor
MIKHNDFELINLIREGNQDALEIMFEKYKPLIYKTISKFNLMYDVEDMYQEGLLMLYKSIRFYNQDNIKTFTRYFQLNLNRKFISIVTQRVRRSEIFSQNMMIIREDSSINVERKVMADIYLDEIEKILTKVEFLVYTLRELKNYSVQYISTNYDLPEKNVYNSLYRAKSKISSHFSN